MYSEKRNWGPTPNYPLVKSYKKVNDNFIVIAGPCSLESDLQINNMASIVKECGATHLRSGVFRAGTYPGSSFGWIDESLINSYRRAAISNGLKNIIEVLDYSDRSFDLINDKCDVFQIGARSQQNYSLLRKIGQYNKPVFLKRNMGSTLDEFLGSAEHLLYGGVKELYLIERGGASIHNHVRWDLSISIIPAIKSITEIPVIVDASHGTGRSDLVEPMTLAGIAAGAKGLLAEVHQDPINSLSDKEQAITPEAFNKLMLKVSKLREALK